MKTQMNANKPTAALVETDISHIQDAIISVLGDLGPLRLEQLQVLLKITHGVTFENEKLLEQILWRLFQKDRQVTKSRTARFCLPGDEAREVTIPEATDYPEAYLRLFLRWRAVRANPELLELTDEMIDSLHLPG